MAPSQGWQTLHNDPDPERHSQLGGHWNIQLPGGTCAYVVLNEDGSVAHVEQARTKRECYERTAAALGGVTISRG